MDKTVKDTAYKDAATFVKGLVGRDNFRPEQMADEIDRKFSISFTNGMTTAENVANQYKRDIAMALTKVIDDKGNIPEQGSSAYKNIVEPVVEGRAVKGSGLPIWKRIEGMAENYKPFEAEVKAQALTRETLKKAAQVAETAVEVGAKFAKGASHIPGIASKFAAAAGIAAATMGVAHAKTPEARNDALKDLAVKGAELVDPTGVILSTAVHEATGRKGDSPMKEALKDISNDRKKTDVGVINQQNLAITREQKFMMSDQHPGQLCALTIKGVDGKPVDVEATLRDPKQRQQVFNEIDKRASTASPQGKELFNEMKMAAIDFASLEDRRRELTPAAPQPVQPQMAVTATKPQAFAPA